MWIGSSRSPASDGRRRGGHVDDARDACPAVPGEIAREFAARHRHPDQRDAAEIERVEHGRKVVRQRVVVVAAARLARAAVTATIVGDAAEAIVDQRGHLVIPHRHRERPGREEDDGASRAPVAMEQVLTVPGPDERTVDSCRRRYVASFHRSSSSKHVET
jgi:hypothetical protein